MLDASAFYASPVKLNHVHLKNRVFLAPLAGVSDVPFRRICQEHGAGLTYVEMLSATALTYHNKRTFEMMARHASESVLGVQVTGQSAEVVEKAVRILHAQGFDTIDINMGCPVKKIVSAGCGSAILKDPARVSATLEAARAVTNKPISAKIRIGYTRDTVNVEEISERIARTDTQMLTIHGRTRSESYANPVDLASIKLGLDAARRAKEILNLSGSNPSLQVENTNQRSDLQNQHSPFICVSNGDLFGTSDALRHHSETHSDAIMVSRGALGNPWIFRQILTGKSEEPNFEEWFDVVMRHISYHIEHYGNTKLGAILMRKHLLWYIKGFQGSKTLREQINCTENLESAKDLIKTFAAGLDLETRRFETNAAVKSSFDYDPKYEMNRQLDRGVGDEGLQSLEES